MSLRTMAGTGATVSSSAVHSSLTACLNLHRIPCTPSVSAHTYIIDHTTTYRGGPGYAWIYGLSLIVGSYPVLFVSLAAHAAQFAFLVFFENPREFLCTLSLVLSNLEISAIRHRALLWPTQAPRTARTHSASISAYQQLNECTTSGTFILSITSAGTRTRPRVLRSAVHSVRHRGFNCF